VATVQGEPQRAVRGARGARGSGRRLGDAGLGLPPRHGWVTITRRSGPW
jgi:hypothetical protein